MSATNCVWVTIAEAIAWSAPARRFISPLMAPWISPSASCWGIWIVPR